MGWEQGTALLLASMDTHSFVWAACKPTISGIKDCVYCMLCVARSSPAREIYRKDMYCTMYIAYNPVQCAQCSAVDIDYTSQRYCQCTWSSAHIKPNQTKRLPQKYHEIYRWRSDCGIISNRPIIPPPLLGLQTTGTIKPQDTHLSAKINTVQAGRTCVLGMCLTLKPVSQI